MSTNYDVIVIGAGITGASAGYFLKKKGVARVLVLDRCDGPAHSNTGKSAGIVRTFYTVPLMARIAKAALDLFHNLPDELGRTGGFEPSGFMQLIPADWTDVIDDIMTMQRSYGIETCLIGPAEYAERFPWLEPDGVAAVLFEPNSGYADPVKTTEAYADAFVAAGGEMRFRTSARGLLRDGDRITGIMLDDGPVSAGAVVNAAGPWAKFLAASVGLEMDLVAVREQDTVWEVREGRPMPANPVGNTLEAVYMRPMGGRRWIIGRGYPKPYVEVDPYNYKVTADNDFEIELLDRMVRRIPSLQGAQLIDSYAALYDVTPDWTPYFGPRAGLEGYCDACGGSGNSFKTGPVLAREMVDWMIDGIVADDFRQLSYDRIAEGNLFKQAFGGNRG